MAARASYCPTTSRRSPVSSGSASSPGSGHGRSSVLPWARTRWKATTSDSERTGCTRIPLTSDASAAFAAGTSNSRTLPASAATHAGRTPRTSLTLPSMPSSPMCPTRATSAGSRERVAARIATAMARSRPAPDFCSEAGARLIVRRVSGNVSSDCVIAERRRFGACDTAVSGSPEMTTLGRPCPTLTSTSTTRPSMPVTTTAFVLPKLTGSPACGDRCGPSPPPIRRQ